MLALIAFALAGTYHVEARGFAEREDAVTAAATARKEGFDARVVKRFELNEGFGFVVLLEGLTTAESATQAAAALAQISGQPTAVYSDEPVPPPEPPPERALTAAEWMDRASDALGGAAGGNDALAQARAVHFVFERTLKIGEKEVTVRHEYWRDGTNRRLEVQTFGNGTDSIAVTTASSAWVNTNGTITPRDIGVLVNTIDAFAPEAILTVATAGYDLLNSPETTRFAQLDGAERGLRFGASGDETSTGLAWIEIDPKTALLESARFVSAGGPVEWQLRDWKRISDVLIVPMQTRVRRPDGRSEVVAVRTFEILDAAPVALFAP